jgi:hypothetical protein
VPRVYTGRLLLTIINKYGDFLKGTRYAYFVLNFRGDRNRTPYFANKPCLDGHADYPSRIRILTTTKFRTMVATRILNGHPKFSASKHKVCVCVRENVRL